MTLRSRLRGAAISTFLGADAARHGLADLKRRVTGGARAVDFYFDLADPASYLAAQAAQRLAAAYPMPIRFHLVSGPAADVDPAPALRLAYAVKDAHELTARVDLDFPGKKPAEPAILKRAHQILLRPRPDAEQLAVALEVAKAVWTSDPKEVTALMGRHGNDDQMSVAPFLATAYGKLRAAGFYQGASFSYGGEWYLGVERLPYLEARLAADTGVTAPPVLTPRSPGPPQRLAVGAGRLVLEVWYSFRSPYSYLAIAQLGALAADLDVDLRLRPLLPLVERGAQMPSMKKMYIARDAHREAARLGIPFGHIADPLGAGARNAIAIQRVATAAGRGLAFAESAMRGIWAEALDVASYVDLRTVVERAGLSWDDARAALADEAWQTEVADAAADLNAAGLWGVPSFKVGDYATWGNDRLPHVAERIRGHRRALAEAPPPPA
ncbi:MAG: DsbA family protein [Myxococcales bacterium]|nr:DsbA family protein [Myxococcales bacterium]